MLGSGCSGRCGCGGLLLLNQLLLLLLLLLWALVLVFVGLKVLHEEFALGEGHGAFAAFEVIGLMGLGVNASLFACLETLGAQSALEGFHFDGMFALVLFVGVLVGRLEGTLVACVDGA